jgi:glycerol-3-phosphate dehydrogenase subunit C
MNRTNHHPDDCIACTSCVANCPVSAATREFHGPKITGPTLERFRRFKNGEDTAVTYCSNCKNCDITCPSGVAVSTLNMLAKKEYYKTHSRSLRDWLLSHGEEMAKLSSPTAALANWGMANPLSRAILKKLGITDKLPLPRYASKTFRQQFNALRQQSFPEKVIFYPGCYINYNDPQIGLDLVAVMQANRIEVIVPADLTCCGSPLVVNGFFDEAEAKGKKNIRQLKHWVDKGYPIITCCTSCGLMLKQEYQELFHIEGNKEVAAKLYDAGEFLMELYDQGRLNTGFKPLSGQYLYHAPCHLRAQGLGQPGLRLLDLLPGMDVSGADAGCCGVAGNYGFKDDKYEIAMAIGDALFHKIKNSGADAVVSECATCRLQIHQATGIKTLHPITLVRRAYEC